MTRIAVVGAGLAGLVVASRLSTHHDVTVFEKSRGVGGRMATRRADPFEFDHGAQFFTAHTAAFQAFLQPLIAAGVVATWNARFAQLGAGPSPERRQWSDDYPHYVGVPGMNAVGKWLARDLRVETHVEVASVRRSGRCWRVTDTQRVDRGEFDWILLTAPAPQTARLAPASSGIDSRASNARMQACCALMLGFDTPVKLPWDAALVRDADISWLSANSSKPGRSDAFAIVAHSTNAWADANIDQDSALIQAHLLEECARIVGPAVAKPSHQALHRWRFANIDTQSGEPFHIDETEQLAVCGDWFIRGRVEGAFTSGDRLGDRLARLL